MNVVGELIAEIPCDDDTYEADFGGGWIMRKYRIIDR